MKVLFANAYNKTVREVELEKTIFTETLKDLMVEGLPEPERTAARDNIKWGQTNIEDFAVSGSVIFDKESANRPNPVTTEIGCLSCNRGGVVHTVPGNYIVISIQPATVDVTCPPDLWVSRNVDNFQAV